MITQTDMNNYKKDIMTGAMGYVKAAFCDKNVYNELKEWEAIGMPSFVCRDKDVAKKCTAACIIFRGGVSVRPVKSSGGMSITGCAIL